MFRVAVGPPANPAAIYDSSAAATWWRHQKSCLSLDMVTRNTFHFILHIYATILHGKIAQMIIYQMTPLFGFHFDVKWVFRGVSSYVPKTPVFWVFRGTRKIGMFSRVSLNE